MKSFPCGDEGTGCYETRSPLPSPSTHPTFFTQGCMNNLTFGDEGMGYYETIAGGAGAGPGWHGRSGVHSHMTNTRITDPEILERRYPVVLHAFRLRPGAQLIARLSMHARPPGWRWHAAKRGGAGVTSAASVERAPASPSKPPPPCPPRRRPHRAGTGGGGRWRGGDGVVRELEFLRPLTASILSERRAVAPFGLLGGGPGAKGVNLLIRRDGRVVSLGGKATVRVDGGDRLRILTPGGGGYGPPDLAAAAGGDGGYGPPDLAAAAGGDGGGGAEEAAAAVGDAAAAERAAAAKRRRTGSGEFSAPLRDGGSVHEYARAQETV